MKKISLILVLCFLSLSANAANSKFITTDFNGNKFDLSEQKGKVVIVNFWAKWCKDCRQEMLILDELYKKYNASGLEIISVSMDHRNQINFVKSLAKRFSYPNSMFADAKENDFLSPRILPINYIMFDGKMVKVLDDTKFLMSDFEAVILPLLKMDLVGGGK